MAPEPKGVPRAEILARGKIHPAPRRELSRLRRPSVEQGRTRSAGRSRSLRTGPQEHRSWRRAAVPDVDLVHIQRLKPLDRVGLTPLDQLQARCVGLQ